MKGFVKGGLAAVIGLAFLAAPAQAQSSLRWNGGVELGFPGQGASTGFGLRVGATFTPQGWPVWIRPEASYDHFGVANCSGSCGSISEYGVIANAGYDFKSSSSLQPYGLAGLGIIHSNWSAPSILPGFSAGGTGVSFDVGGGVRTPLGGMTGYGELRYHAVGSGWDYFAITVGLLFGKK